MDWWRCDPIEFLDDQRKLTARQRSVFWTCVQLIYVHRGAIENDPREIAGNIPDMRSDAIRRTIDELLAMGKLELTTSGQLTQKRALADVTEMQKRRQRAALDGSKASLRGVRSAEIKGLTPTEKRRGEKNIGEGDETRLRANGSHSDVLPGKGSPAEPWHLTDADREHALGEGLTSAEIAAQSAELVDQISGGRRDRWPDGRLQWKSWVRSYLGHKAAHRERPQKSGSVFGGQVEIGLPDDEQRAAAAEAREAARQASWDAQDAYERDRREAEAEDFARETAAFDSTSTDLDDIPF